MVKSKQVRAISGGKNKPDLSGASGVFLAAALDMSWRLALSVLVPIVGGHFLDEAFNSSPWFTVAGFVVAFAGVVIVMKRVVADSNRHIAEFNSRKEGPK